MKSRIFVTYGILFLLFYLPATLEAQIGIKAGLGVSDITFKDRGQTPYLGYEINSLEHKLPLLTYQIGVQFTFEIANHFDFQPELLLVSQGLDYSTEYLFDDITYKVKSHYLQFPLLLKYRTSVNKNKLSGLIAGAYGSLKLSANKITVIDGEREKTAMENIKQTDFGIMAGYVFDFNLLSRKMLIDVRSSYSLINIMDRIDGSIPAYNAPKDEYARNVSITLTVEYHFSLDKPKIERL